MNKRPIGVSILAVLHTFGGVVAAGLSLLLVAKFEMLSRFADAVGIPPALFVVCVVLLAVVYAVSGIGMWRGTRWGWWLGAFSYSYAVARAVSGLLLLYRFGSVLQDDEGLSDADLRKMSIKFTGRTVVGSLLFLYFFKSNVLAYFGLDHLGKAKAAGILIAVMLAMFVLITAVGWPSQ